MAWLHAPMPNPTATGSFTRNSFTRKGAVRLPRIPVTITAATVMETMPPWPSDTAVAMGVVTDLGSREAVMAASRPNRRLITRMLPTDTTTPVRHPTSTGSQFRLSRSFLA